MAALNTVRTPSTATFLFLLLVVTTIVAAPGAQAQQFNSDNYWTAPHGTETTVLTLGEHYSTLLVVAALFPGWEFNIGTTLFRKDQEANTTDHFSALGYVKYMFYENKAKTGGLAAMGGTGLNPGYLEAGTTTSNLKTYWFSVPVTFPFNDGAISWDLLPGVAYNREYGTSNDTAWGATYSTRLAVYKVIPQSAIVGEVFGTAGEAYSEPQYRAGVRWETKYVITALTYGAALDGSRGAGVELGVMTLSPPFLCFGGCK